ncbi:MAG TPA: DUF87 domain-containing protein [Solirubrobacteraceae bacterium]|jgi:hypothetical protein|nr:DUF87 domain-containing protein [Solirubrobacteraceae bacterium]
MALDLFPDSHVVGVFRGFREGGMEFHADLSLPYRSDFQSKPMHGAMLLVQLETPDEAVLGRIASFSSEGRLASGSGEEFNIRAVREGRQVPEDLREEYLRYRVNIRVLGVLRRSGSSLVFVASHRRLPHVGSRVAFPAEDVLREIIGHNGDGVPIGHYALGEYIYAAGSKELGEPQSWMQVLSPEIFTTFPVDALVSRRSFIFARAGFGKSNLTKLLFSTLYHETPTVEKRAGRRVPVGTVIFDPDGEYFWPDDKGRPGLCDVEELEDKVVVFTSRKGPSDFYQSFVAGGVRLDIRRLKPADVIAIALAPERQDQQNVIKLRGLSSDRWERLVDIIDKDGNGADLATVAQLLNLDAQNQQYEAMAARSNMTAIVRQIHDRSSLLMDRLIRALKDGKLCVVDVSQMRGTQALVLSGLILRRIFEHNQNEFVKAVPETIPTIAVVEEAQSVLNDRSTAAEPYIAWVKEGRKYDLGAMLITQQPGSIPSEILSQGDNWFIFHLLSTGDLGNVRKANAHFSDDVLSGLLNEPIPGQGVFWSSAAAHPYPISMRAFSFEQLYSPLDGTYKRGAADTYASKLKQRFDSVAATAMTAAAVMPAGVATTDSDPTSAKMDAGAIVVQPGAVTAAVSNDEGQTVSDGSGDDADKPDVFVAIETQVIRLLEKDETLMGRIRNDGVAWGSVKAFFLDNLPKELDNRDGLAYGLVAKAMDSLLGPQDQAWHTFRHPERQTTYVKAGPAT